MRKRGYASFDAKWCQQFSRDIMAYKVCCKLQSRLLVLHSAYVSDKTNCARGDTICPAPHLSPWAPSRAPPSSNVAVLSQAEYVPTLTDATTLCVKAALSKRPGDLGL